MDVLPSLPDEPDMSKDFQRWEQYQRLRFEISKRKSDDKASLLSPTKRGIIIVNNNDKKSILTASFENDGSNSPIIEGLFYIFIDYFNA